jgi:ABC-type transport system involved in multi-copper enzyme maturation permease subunit
MKSIWILAKNTYLEIIRDRVLYGLLVFAFMLVGTALALGQLSFTEQARISGNFGMAAIHLSAVALSIFVGSSLVYKEIDKQTILTLLVRPLTRTQFLLGKTLGLFLIVFSIVFGLSIVQMLIFFGLGLPITIEFFLSLSGILIESLILMGFALFFGTFSSPFLVVSFSLAIFLIGHWVENLNFLAEKSGSAFFTIFAKVSIYILPNLERFNWREYVVYGGELFADEIFNVMLYGLGWWVLLITVTSMIFRRKDFA